MSSEKLCSRPTGFCASTALRGTARPSSGGARSALLAINNILEQRPLGTFTAEHLEFLETLIAYWRELEVEAGAPEPEHMH
jgi:hypothetical protein